MKIRSKNRGGKPDRLTVGQFLEMIRQRVFLRDVRIELLRGILIEHPKRSPEHNDSVGALGDELRKYLPLPWFVSEEKDLELDQTTGVGPDIALIRGPEDQYRARDPRVGESGLLIEVADATYLHDRGVKLRAYASAMIPSYWILNLPKRQIEVYRDPSRTG